MKHKCGLISKTYFKNNWKPEIMLKKGFAFKGLHLDFRIEGKSPSSMEVNCLIGASVKGIPHLYRMLK
jgi:hypothetical protein